MQVHVWTLRRQIIEYLNDCYALAADFLSGPSSPWCVMTGGTLDWGVVIWDILPHVSIFHPRVIITQIIYHRGRYTTISHNQSPCDRRHVLISLPTTNGNCAFSLTCVLELLGLHLNWKAGKINPPLWMHGCDVLDENTQGPVGWHVSSAIFSAPPSLHTKRRRSALSNNSG